MPKPPTAAPAASAAATPAQPDAPAFSPLYRQIKALILASLRQGEWKPSTAIPSEAVLAQRFEVSQGTVRKAIEELAAENILIRRQGRGTFVSTHVEQRVRYRFLKLTPDDGDAPRAVQRRILSCKRVRPSPAVSQALNLPRGEAVLQVRRVLSFADAPVILEDICLPAGAFKGLTAGRMNSYGGPMYALFESEFGVHMVRAEEKIRAVLPDPAQSAWLKVTPTTPLLSVERIAYTYNNVPMELRCGLYLTQTCHYRNALS